MSIDDKIKRYETLLKAAYELLKKQEKSEYTLDLLSETVFYDEADCDGYCLMEDIAIELDLEDKILLKEISYDK
jgi:hypothetical protein